MNAERIRGQAEEQKRVELAKLFRPIDKEDKGWMSALGCKWSTGETAEQEWIAGVNKLVIIGSERQSSHPDFNTVTTYQAREAFLGLMPVANTAARRIMTYTGGHISQGYIPTDGFVGTQRLLYGNGFDIEKITKANPSVVIVRPKQVMDRLDNLTRHGIDVKKLVQNNYYTAIWSQSSEHLSTKLGALYAIARACGWEDAKQAANRIIEEVPTTLNYRADKIRTLARISVELFEPLAPEDISRNTFFETAILPLETQVAGYLKQGKNIKTPEGLIYQARWLRGYTRDELRGYIWQHAKNHTDAKGRPADPVVRTYLRHFPISDEETERLPHLTELPARPKGYREPQEDYGQEAYRTNKHAHTNKEYIRTLKQFPPASPGQQHEYLDAISAGLNVEQSSIDPLLYTDDEKATVDEGRNARKKLHASLAAKVLALRYPDSGRFVFEGEDAEQNGMLMLMMAVITLAERRKDTRPENIWPYLEERIRNTKLILAEEDDGDSYESGYHQDRQQVYPKPNDESGEIAAKM